MPKMSEDPALYPKGTVSQELRYPKRIFVICPVRNIKPEILKFLTAYVENLEKNPDCIVYWPYRDNPFQKIDKIGMKILLHNRSFMIDADEVHIYYDRESIGSVFDFGMLLMCLELYNDKGIILINPEDVWPTPEKSFENFILELVQQFSAKEEE
jgi:hypothetical protein